MTDLRDEIAQALFRARFGLEQGYGVPTWADEQAAAVMPIITREIAAENRWKDAIGAYERHLREHGCGCGMGRDCPFELHHHSDMHGRGMAYCDTVRELMRALPDGYLGVPS